MRKLFSLFLLSFSLVAMPITSFAQTTNTISSVSELSQEQIIDALNKINTIDENALLKNINFNDGSGIYIIPVDNQLTLEIKVTEEVKPLVNEKQGKATYQKSVTYEKTWKSLGFKICTVRLNGVFLYDGTNVKATDSTATHQVHFIGFSANDETSSEHGNYVKGYWEMIFGLNAGEFDLGYTVSDTMKVYMDENGNHWGE